MRSSLTAALTLLSIFLVSSSFLSSGSSASTAGGADEVASMLQSVPASLHDFELSANGLALTKRDGRDGPFTEADVRLRATVTLEDEKYSLFHATGRVQLSDGRIFNITDTQGAMIFFKESRGGSIAGLLNIAGRHAVDDDGNDLGKFRLRALIIDSSDQESWKIAVSPSAKIGKHILLVNMDGTVSST
jgi:hypothetical protein